MSEAEQLLSLAERVEQAAGPDRELDARIAHAIAWRWDGWEDGDLVIEDKVVDYVIDRTINSFSSVWRLLPAYTSSLDAAMTLMPEETEINLHRYQHDKENGRRWRANLTHWPTPPIPLPLTTTWHGHGSSGALALTAVCLRARAQTTGEPS